MSGIIILKSQLSGNLIGKLKCNRLQNWLSNNNILTHFQHGFRKKKSTIFGIATLLGNICKIYKILMIILTALFNK